MRCYELPLAVALSAALVSCTGKVTVGGDVLPLVKNIVSDRTGRAAGLLENYDGASPRGGIYIVGEPDRVADLAHRFAISDTHDNVDGSFRPDSLPDFSGETICAFKDSLYSPYNAAFPAGNEIKLRETVVRQALWTLDTLCHLSPFDVKGLGTKTAAKIIVFTSPSTALYGIPDVDTLGNLMNRRLAVMNPLESTLTKLFRNIPGKLNVGVIAKKGTAASGVYDKIFERYSARFGRKDCTVYVSERRGALSDPLREFLDSYLDSGNSAALSAIIIDDFDVDVPTARKSFREITSVMSSEYPVYEKVLSRRTDIHSTAEDVTEQCFAYMRESNIFTHLISFPRLENYYTAASPAGNDPFILIKDTAHVQR